MIGVILLIGGISWFLLLRAFLREVRCARNRPPLRPFPSYEALKEDLEMRGWTPLTGSATWWRREEDLGVVVRQADGHAFLTKEEP